MNELEELLKKVVRLSETTRNNVKRGLYRRYDGVFVVVHELIRIEDLGLCAMHYPINNPGAMQITDVVNFAGYLYLVDVVDENGKVESVTRSILEHPDNVTGQANCHIRVESIDNFEKNLPTESLLNELRKRDDNPYSGLDDEAVEFTDYAISVHGEDNKGEFMINDEVWDTLEKAMENKAKFNKAHNVYNRCYIKAN